MPKCSNKVPLENLNNRYFERRSIFSNVFPTTLCTSSGIGQRNLALRTTTSATFCPAICGVMPKRQTSTSGNSGILK